LDEIARLIHADNPSRAISFVKEISGRFVPIAERPRSFPARNELLEGLRSALHGKYLILFIENDSHIRIVRVVHGSRNLARLLMDEKQ